MNILILSHPEDLHAKQVLAQLEKLGASCSFFDSEQLLSGSTLTFERDSRRQTVLTDSKANRIDLTKVNSIWLRRPGAVRAARMPERWMEAMVEWESFRALSGVWRTLDCFWVNDPTCQNEALLKVNQLESAIHSGLTIPATIVTNEPSQARDFYDRMNGDVIYKMVDEYSTRYMPTLQGPRGMPTMPMVADDIEFLNQVSLSMHLFQQRVNKVCDVRVTIVGQQIFAARIESQLGEGKLDFRLDYSVPIVRWQLPAEVEVGLLGLMQRLGLQFGAIDLCLDQNDRYFFLEVNPAGQYLWIEDALGYPISLELAKLLTGKSPRLRYAIAGD